MIKFGSIFFILVQFLTILSINAEVSVLTNDNFDQETASGVWMIKFYAPWCGHCKKLAPIYDQLSDENDLEGAKVGKVDCTAHSQVCARFEVRGYPTLKVISNGKHYPYSSGRDINSMKNFLKGSYKDAQGEDVLSEKQLKEKQAAENDMKKNTKVIALTTKGFENRVLSSKDTWMIKFYAPWCGHCKRLTPTWNQLSLDLQKDKKIKIAKVDCTTHRRVCSRFGVQGYPTLKLVKDGQVYPYSSQRSVKALSEFIKEGYQNVDSEPIPDETFFASMVDSLLEWAAEHTVLAAILGFVALVAMVGFLVVLLDYCLGDVDELTEEEKEKVPQVKKMVEGTDKAE